ncbi:hypothetical protein MGYG_00741 [Nannizzia gypsea CBS 118893]|uniref:Uncharacterized protein n=1 Tax=Arthroderma gypseum (strain ATCC MYA-4604 / CBS 118893) TaxID=535722 RepID=E5R1F1_ARTGP|nr:hypothetical protein MGYG_00741 [Nannizzia gypsea CBS 118893]EFQ97702.1 hypothetical protein MGYG_00741 [Nannizzia gypsea CBS 118893]
MVNPALFQNLKGISLSLGDVTLKQPTSWGFVVYRCSYNNEDAWQAILQQLRDKIARSLELEEREDLLPRHEMILMDDRAKFNGATSHDIRDHFTSWVSDTLPDILVTPPTVVTPTTESERQLTPVNHPHSEQSSDFGTRYNFCLFADDICLESIEHMKAPVIKLLARDFGVRGPAERDYIIHPDYEDGETDNEEEDVGWMYLEVLDYVNVYDTLEEDDWWYELYRRPPLLPYDSIADQNPGFWRND